MRSLTGDPSADAYLAALVSRARDQLGAAFVGAYLVNSGARGDYLPGRSDLDVALIVDGPLDGPTARRLGDALRHRRLACPAPRLELVAYRRDVAARPGSRPAFELNLNTGPSISDHVAVDPAVDPWFWFVLDLGAAADAAVAIGGPPPGRIFGPVPRGAVLEALRASGAWHAAADAASANRVLNACRAWCWIETGRWRSKSAAATWAIEAGGEAELIGHAMALRAGQADGALPGERVDAFTERIGRMIDEAAAAEPPTR